MLNYLSVLRRSATGNDVSVSTLFAGNDKISGNTIVCAKQVTSTYVQDTLRTLDLIKLVADLSAHVQRPK